MSAARLPNKAEYVSTASERLSQSCSCFSSRPFAFAFDAQTLLFSLPARFDCDSHPGACGIPCIYSARSPTLVHGRPPVCRATLLGSPNLRCHACFSRAHHPGRPAAESQQPAAPSRITVRKASASQHASEVVEANATCDQVRGGATIGPTAGIEASARRCPADREVSWKTARWPHRSPELARSSLPRALPASRRPARRSHRPPERCDTLLYVRHQEHIPRPPPSPPSSPLNPSRCRHRRPPAAAAASIEAERGDCPRRRAHRRLRLGPLAAGCHPP